MAAPIINTISKSVINPCQTLIANGSNFGASGAKCWLSPTDNFGDTSKVEFYVISHDDVTLTARVTPKKFTDGTYYLFIENSGAETNASGEPVSLVTSEQKLIAGNPVEVFGGSSPNYMFSTQCKSLHDGVVTNIRAYCSAPGNLKWAIWNTNTPPLPLVESKETDQPVNTGWNVFDTAKFNVSVDGYFYLGFAQSNNILNICASPALYGLRFNAITYSTWTAPNPYTGSYSGAQAMAYTAYGYALPTIATKDRTTINPGQTLNLTGDDFMSSGSKLWLADDSNFATANKVEFTDVSHTNTTLSATVPLGTSGDGAYYLFVETDLGLVNEVGEMITFQANVVDKGGFYADGLAFELTYSHKVMADGIIIVGNDESDSVFADGDKKR